MFISRRTALLGGALGGVSACATKPQLGAFTSTMAADDSTFACGVASGDPGLDSVVLWTRISGAEGGAVRVAVEVALDDNFAKVIWRDVTETDASRDYTVKVLADRLEPGRRYAYRFAVMDRVSPTGFTRTLPEETESARFAVASCSNYPYGYFNAYDHIARQQDLDAVLHLGDYIYEYGPDGYGGEKGKALGRNHLPPREITTLDDYRQRHRQYKSDPASRRMHAAHPLIAIWDDHETSNDSFKSGAENHQPDTEGTWSDRKRAAMQAYYEYMPVRDPEPGRTREQLFKHHSWGRYLTVTSIESRLNARTKPLNYVDGAKQVATPEGLANYRDHVLGAEDRELLGAAQLQFVEDSLRQSVDSGATWRLIANQVLFARVALPALQEYVGEEQIAAVEPLWPEVRDFIAYTAAGLPYNTDSWDGYPKARQRFYDRAAAAGARDLVVLTGDTHQFWANDLKTDNGGQMGVELGTSGVTSPGPSQIFGEQAFDFSLLMRRDNPEIRYADAMNNGYILLTLEGDEGEAEFITIDTVDQPRYSAVRGAAFALVQKNGTVEFGAPRGLGFKERVLYR